MKKKKTYYVHECSGERFDGTSFYNAWTEYCYDTKKAIKETLKPYDIEKEFYTEHHSFQFFNSKRECEEYELMKEESEPFFNYIDNFSYSTKDGYISIDYHYDKKEKTVWLYHKGQPGIADETAVLDFTFDGELIGGKDEYGHEQCMKALDTVQKYMELFHEFTTKKNDKEGA